MAKLLHLYHDKPIKFAPKEKHKKLHHDKATGLIYNIQLLYVIPWRKSLESIQGDFPGFSEIGKFITFYCLLTSTLIV